MAAVRVGVIGGHACAVLGFFTYKLVKILQKEVLAHSVTLLQQTSIFIDRHIVVEPMEERLQKRGISPQYLAET